MKPTQIDLNLFTVFDAIYQSGGITPASKRLHLSQPAVSHALRRLRELLGDPLFARKGNVMVPTPRARELAGTVRTCLEHLDRISERCSLFEPASASRRFRIAVRHIHESSLLPRLFVRLAREAPDVAVETVRIERSTLAEDLAAKRNSTPCTSLSFAVRPSSRAGSKAPEQPRVTPASTVRTPFRCFQHDAGGTMDRQLLGCLILFALSSQGSVRAFAQAARRPEPPSTVFTLSNEAEDNRVLAFAAGSDGNLSEPVAYSTQGTGSGDSLGSQGALVLSEDHRFLLVVNAGSDDITSFAVNAIGLSLQDRVSSGGTRPISITERRGLVFVVHAGGVNDVVGFYLDARGMLHRLPGATRPLSADSVGPGQIELTPDARQLVVTEKTTSKLDVFDVSAFGRLGPPTVVSSAGNTPFGFEFTQRGTLIVSEAASASLSSYELSRRDGLEVISAAVPDTQAAPCWVAISNDDRYAFTANAGSASISSYEIAAAGQITLKQARAADLGTDATPLDLALGRGGRYLYVLDRGHTRVAAFSLAADGTLAPLTAAGTLPPFSTGLAAY